MEAHVGVAKTPKYGLAQSGDTVEMVERPRGGFSLVMADGQGSGDRARRISQLVVAKAVSLLSEGARDGAVARAVHDYLFSLRDGKVAATLSILSLDLDTRSLVLTQNGNHLACIGCSTGMDGLEALAGPIGVHARTRPQVVEYPLEQGLVVAMATDGVAHAGRRRGRNMNLEGFIDIVSRWEHEDSQALADELLYQALVLDENRPEDDMSVLTLQLLERREEVFIRRLQVSFPFR